MKQLNAYLHFNNNCREAMTFYKDVLEGELNIQTAGESGMGDQTPEEMKNQVIHSELRSEKFTIMGSDMFGNNPTHGNQIKLCIVCESSDEINSFYTKLSEGGEIHNPLKEEFFGTFADFTDKFGVNWMLQFSNNQ